MKEWRNWASLKHRKISCKNLTMTKKVDYSLQGMWTLNNVQKLRRGNMCLIFKLAYLMSSLKISAFSQRDASETHHIQKQFVSVAI